MTVLAFVFVPISLASSIFGMDVAQINGTGPNVWAFVLTSVALLVVSLVVWLMWRAGRNWSAIIRASKGDHRMVWEGEKSAKRVGIHRHLNCEEADSRGFFHSLRHVQLRVCHPPGAERGSMSSMIPSFHHLFGLRVLEEAKRPSKEKIHW